MFGSVLQKTTKFIFKSNNNKKKMTDNIVYFLTALICLV